LKPQNEIWRLLCKERERNLKANPKSETFVLKREKETYSGTKPPQSFFFFFFMSEVPKV